MDTLDTSATSEVPQPPEWATQLFQMIQTQNQRMEGLEQRLQAQSIGGSAPTPETTGTPMEESVREPMAVRQKKKLPELPEFTGKRTEFRPWLTQAKAKLSVDKGTETEVVRF